MLNTALFGIFASLFFTLFYFWVREPRNRLVLVLLFNVLFISYQSPVALILLLFLSGSTYMFAKKIEHADSTSKRYRWLAVAVGINILSLLIFRGSLNIDLPYASFGLAFYTLQLMGSVIDIYRGRWNTRDGFVPYLASLSFFAHIGSGPVIKARELIPQIQRLRLASSIEMRLASLLIANGLFKKAIADLLAPTVYVYFHSQKPHDIITAWTATLALASQFYADFAGYTDIALGLGLLCGVHLPQNFRLPYLAQSPAEHWRRWHISLGDWVREYLFVPLLCTRGGTVFGTIPFTYFAVLVSMGLIGLWHGVHLNFLFWGVANGVLICTSPMLFRLHRGIWRGLIGIALTFYLTALARVFVATHSWRETVFVWKEMHAVQSLHYTSFSQMIWMLIISGGLIGPHLVDFFVIHHEEAILKNKALWLVLTITLFAFALATGESGFGFLYMRF
jgi:D-alanyl-lipoteichoic acid acyltransferase DltB (MBOAT superfamily)